MDKKKYLKTNHSKQWNKYYRTMSYRIMNVEVDAMYNVLVLGERSNYELTRRHEANVIRILNIK